MKVKGLDGKEYIWKPETYHEQREFASNLHNRARELLHRLFPFYQINEEILLVGTPTKLYLDMYIHPLRAAFEVHGSQHYKFNSFFFSSAKDFMAAKKRDMMKIEWCEINKIDLVCLPYNEDNDEWEIRICNRGIIKN
jgi:hypothetical protein